MTTRVGVIGDRTAGFAPHDALDAAVAHADPAASVVWLPTEALAAEPSRAHGFDALWCAPGSPYRSLDGALGAIRHAREAGVPFLGTCGGFQHLVLEYARHVLGFADAAHAEYDPYASRLFVSELACSLAGMELGIDLVPGTRAATAYGDVARVTEAYYCNFGLAPEHRGRLEAGGLVVSGTDAADGDARIVELPGHPFFVGTLYVPQVASRPDAPHPLVVALLAAAT
jgi:CTP synthase (UTP-ammonia lyase)